MTAGKIDPFQVLKSVQRKSAGGSVLFVGTIRNRSEGKEVKGLEYEVYKRMAERRLKQIEREARERWPITSISVVHREGKLKVGEASVAVAVSAEHRAEAFEAARFAIDQIKQVLPIWKRETFTGGKTVWSKGTPISR